MPDKSQSYKLSPETEEKLFFGKVVLKMRDGHSIIEKQIDISISNDLLINVRAVEHAIDFTEHGFNNKVLFSISMLET